MTGQKSHQIGHYVFSARF